MSPKSTSYIHQLEQVFGEVIQNSELSDLRKQFLRSRWLDQTLWMEARASRARNSYYILRLTAIVGGVIIPTLVSLSLEGQPAIWLRGAVFAISLAVAISGAVEGFFRYGDRWRHYRQTAETLKSEGWEFFQLSSHYSRYQNLAEAYPRFAGWVEDVIRHDVEAYISQVVREKEEKQQEHDVNDKQS
jgi:hypothetical protein